MSENVDSVNLANTNSRLQRSSVDCSPSTVGCFQVSGGFAGGATPVPISNTEVKPSRADGTAGETLWESRTPPGSLPEAPASRLRGGGFTFSAIDYLWW